MNIQEAKSVMVLDTEVRKNIFGLPSTRSLPVVVTGSFLSKALKID